MTTQPTDPSPLLFAEYLNDEIYTRHYQCFPSELFWKNGLRVDDTQFLDLCHRIECKMDYSTKMRFVYFMANNMPHGEFTVCATWQQRLAAIHETLKGTKP